MPASTSSKASFITNPYEGVRPLTQGPLIPATAAIQPYLASSKLKASGYDWVLNPATNCYDSFPKSSISAIEHRPEIRHGSPPPRRAGPLQESCNSLKHQDRDHSKATASLRTLTAAEYDCILDSATNKYVFIPKPHVPAIQYKPEIRHKSTPPRISDLHKEDIEVAQGPSISKEAQQTITPLQHQHRDHKGDIEAVQWRSLLKEAQQTTKPLQCQHRDFSEDIEAQWRSLPEEAPKTVKQLLLKYRAGSTSLRKSSRIRIPSVELSPSAEPYTKSPIINVGNLQHTSSPFIPGNCLCKNLGYVCLGDCSPGVLTIPNKLPEKLEVEVALRMLQEELEASKRCTCVTRGQICTGKCSDDGIEPPVLERNGRGSDLPQATQQLSAWGISNTKSDTFLKDVVDVSAMKSMNKQTSGARIVPVIPKSLQKPKASSSSKPQRPSPTEDKSMYKQTPGAPIVPAIPKFLQKPKATFPFKSQALSPIEKASLLNQELDATISHAQTQESSSESGLSSEGPPNKVKQFG